MNYSFPFYTIYPRSEKLYWSDVAVDMIYGADLDGSNPVPIVSDDILLVGKFLRSIAEGSIIINLSSFHL